MRKRTKLNYEVVENKINFVNSTKLNINPPRLQNSLKNLKKISINITRTLTKIIQTRKLFSKDNFDKKKFAPFANLSLSVRYLIFFYSSVRL